AGEELKRLVAARERLAKHLSCRLRGESIYRLLAHAGEAAELSEAPVVQREEAVTPGAKSELRLRRGLGREGAGRMPVIFRLVLRPPTVREKCVEVGEALVGRPTEQLSARAGQVLLVHGLSSVRDWAKG